MFDDINKRDLEAEIQELEEKLLQKEQQIRVIQDLSNEYFSDSKRFLRVLKEYQKKYGDDLAKEICRQIDQEERDKKFSIDTEREED